MSRSGAEILREVVDAFNARDFSNAHEHLSDDLEFVDVAAGATTKGRDAFIGYAQSWIGAFPDMKMTLLAVVADEQHVAGEFRGGGTHEGTLPTPAGDIPPTGRRFEEPFTWFCEVADGKLTGIRDYYNAMALMTQLGLMPEAAAAAHD
jgi:steroid delta-isomerase-like uncharacterized protein